MPTPNRDPSAAQLIGTKTWATVVKDFIALKAAAVVAGAIVTPEDHANILNAALAASLEEAASTTPDDSEAYARAIVAAKAASVVEEASAVQARALEKRLNDEEFSTPLEIICDPAQPPRDYEQYDYEEEPLAPPPGPLANYDDAAVRHQIISHDI